MFVVRAARTTSMVSLIYDSIIDYVASTYSLMRTLSHLPRHKLCTDIVGRRWAYTTGRGLPAQRIETNMFAFISHSPQIFLDGHLRWPTKGVEIYPSRYIGRGGSGLAQSGGAGGRQK